MGPDVPSNGLGANGGGCDMMSAMTVMMFSRKISCTHDRKSPIAINKRRKVTRLNRFRELRSSQRMILRFSNESRRIE